MSTLIPVLNFIPFSDDETALFGEAAESHIAAVRAALMPILANCLV